MVLDSFERGFRKYEKIGYQYKFYPSPLSRKYRRKIEESLRRVAENQKTLKLDKWVLVTPQDFVESSTRKDGGDMTWFESLPEKLGLKFEIEHWGHKKLLALFLETPSLCLYYYPELVHNGAARRKTIQDTRERYDDNLDTLYRKIEFVGMSVYKPEAVGGIPMENIYIPLTVIQEGADETDPYISKVNPISFLEPGARHVILGDPGSGKSTLLRFLALVGISEALQNRCSTKPDNRLPILITLRRYIDELKTGKDLSLIDYIQEVIQTDFNLKSADLDFFEYYLESGQTILLFDGLDELPNPQYKKKVRDQIRTLITTYPGNTVVATSRIVGYGSPFRFDEKEFAHYKLTRLQLPEIEQFVRNWYKIHIKKERGLEERVNDLVRILKNKNYRAIRELAENPLLLTIIVLVHRIDAVLPDARVVLYHKCTETLLNTWYIWKFQTDEVRNSRVERYNRRRMEEIAYWMHCQSVGAGKNQRTVVGYEDMKKFLTDYIAENEKFRDPTYEPVDLAEEFLDFVKKRTGLLVEISDNRYSFIHSTFQEYLASSCILTRGETGGVSDIWEIIEETCEDARWHEIIRLLIAGLKSDKSQEFLVKRILEKTEYSQDVMYPLLLGGLMLDEIQAAKGYSGRVLYYLLRSASKATDSEQLRPILTILRTWIAKQDSNQKAAGEAFKYLWKALKSDKEKIALLLIGSAINWSETKINGLTENFFYEKSEGAELCRLFLGETSNVVPSTFLRKRLELFWAAKDVLSLTSGFSNFVAAVCQAVTASLESSIVAKRAFEVQMVMLFPRLFYGPFTEYTLNSLKVFLDDRSRIYERVQALSVNLDRDSNSTMTRALSLDEVVARAMAQLEDVELAQDWTVARALSLDMALDRALDRVATQFGDLDWNSVALERLLARAGDVYLDRILDQSSEMDIWQAILATPDLYSLILDFLCDIFTLEPRAQWWEALRVRFLPGVPQSVTLFGQTAWKKIETVFETRETGETETYTAAWQLIFDAWLCICGYYQSKEESIFKHLADITRKIDAPPLCIAHCIRDLAYEDKSRIEDLVSMIKSDNPDYRVIFESTFWRPRVTNVDSQ